MNTSILMWSFVVIIAIAAVLYLVSFFMRRRNDDQLGKLEERKIDLFDLPVIEELDDVKKMHLVGQSQNTFREWNQRWTEISTKSFAQLESLIFEVESLNDSFRFIKAQKAIKKCEETLNTMEDRVETIRLGLKELRESEERNSMKVQQALDMYEDLSRTLKENSTLYGPALPELKKQLGNIEIQFTQFVTLNTTGDPVEARDVLEAAEQKTYEMESIVSRIPQAYHELNQEFPEQVSELESGYKKLAESHFVFPNKQNLEADIKKLQLRIKNNMADLEKCEIDSVETLNSEIAAEIDSLYEIMEREINAKTYVKQNETVLYDFIHHAMRNNRQLMIEIDHTSQSYALTHNELGQSRVFQAQLEEIQRQNTRVNEQMEKHEAIFSEVEQFYKDTLLMLDELENEQVQIDKGLQQLRKDEKEAEQKVNQFEFKLRNLKRHVEKQRLPGLPADYLEFFYVATDRIEELAKELNRIRINIDQIQKIARMCQEDLDILEEKTQELIDQAAITEELLQYANRYRHSHPGISESIEYSSSLFSKDFNYQQALAVISESIEKVEPGACQRIESIYFKDNKISI